MDALERARGNQSEAARLLRISRESHALQDGEVQPLIAPVAVSLPVNLSAGASSAGSLLLARLHADMRHAAHQYDPGDRTEAPIARFMA